MNRYQLVFTSLLLFTCLYSVGLSCGRDGARVYPTIFEDGHPFVIATITDHIELEAIDLENPVLSLRLKVEQTFGDLNNYPEFDRDEIEILFWNRSSCRATALLLQTYQNWFKRLKSEDQAAIRDGSITPARLKAIERVWPRTRIMIPAQVSRVISGNGRGLASTQFAPIDPAFAFPYIEALRVFNELADASKLR